VLERGSIRQRDDVACGGCQSFVNVHHWAQAWTGRGSADAVIAVAA
jgi:hypothetical protein